MIRLVALLVLLGAASPLAQQRDFGLQVELRPRPIERAAVDIAPPPPPPLVYETLEEPPPDTAAAARALAEYTASPSADTLHELTRALIQNGDADTAWTTIETFGGDTKAKAYFAARLATINANLAASGGLGKLKWAKRLNAHCGERTDIDPEDEEALECLAKYHNRAPSMAGGDKDLAVSSLLALRGLNPGRADMVEAELVFKDDPQRARTLVDQAVAYEDLYDPGLLQAAMVYGYFKDWDAAEAALNRVPAGSEVSGMRHYQLGKLAAEHGEKLAIGEQALLVFLQGDTRQLGVDFRGPAHWRLGQIFVHTKRYEMARKAFETALEYNPRLKPAKKDLKALKALEEETR